MISNKCYLDDDEFCNIIGAFKDDKLVACVTLRQLRQVGSSHKAMIENLFLLDKKMKVQF